MTSLKRMKGNILEVYIKPNAKKTGIEGLHNGRIKIKIVSPPEKGKANKELIGLVSKITGISKSRIRIISGITSNYKNILISGKTDKDYTEILLTNSTK